MLRFLLITLFITSISYSQETFNLDWQQGINGDQASVTIASGDTVTWTWTNGSPHNVVARQNSAESFQSQTIAQEGFTFSYTFTVVGDNPYVCTVHPSSMFGTITVQNTMSIEEKFQQNLRLYPTAVASQTQLTSLYAITQVKVYDLSGSEIQTESGGNSNLMNFDFSDLSSGLYFMKISGDDGQTATMKFQKK
jgi:plastocyanin